MTFREMVIAVVRRWYVVIVVLGAFVVLTDHFERDGGLYFTRTAVIFSGPGQDPLAETPDENVILFAREVARMVNGGREPVSYAAADAPYYGAGIRHGYRVGLPNVGGQWAVSYTRAVVEVQVVSPDADWLADKQTDLVRQVRTAAERIQESVEVKPRERITTSVDPLTTQVGYVAPTRSTRFAALAAIAVAAGVTAGSAAVLVDTVVTRLRHRRRRAPDPAPMSPGGQP